MKINKGMRYEGWGKSLASTLRTLAMVVAGLFAIDAKAAGFDGKTLVTNSWFDANFTALTANTDITQGSDTGITLGAGSWTSVPATATAQIVADADAGGEATLLSVDIDTSDLLTFSPAPNAITSGYETVSVDIKTDPVYDLPTLDNTVQGAFLLYMDGEENLSLQGYTSAGWTNLVGATASDLTNVWMTVYTDYATVSDVRYVRYSVKLGDSLAILEDSVGTTWFPSAASTKTALESVSFTGSGKIRTFSGKELQEAVASYNDVNYATVADAIAAAEEGGTITLSRSTESEVLTVDKNVTIVNGGNMQLNASSIYIADGVTLTLHAFNKQNTIGAITGNGNLVTTGGNTLRINLAGDNYSLASLTTSDGLQFEGYGTVTVAGDVNVTKQINFNTSYSSTAATAHNGYTIKLAANSISAMTLEGAGMIETTEGVATTGSSTFGGRIAGAGDVVLNGSGKSLTLRGPNTFTGALNVKAGTVNIDSSLTDISHLFRLDASVADSIATDESGYVTNWVSQTGSIAFTNESSKMVVTTDYFNGGKAVATSTSKLLSAELKGSGKSTHAQHLIGALRVVTTPTARSLFYGSASNYGIGKHGSRAGWRKQTNGSTSSDSDIWQNGVLDTTFYQKEEVLSVLGFSRNSSVTYEGIGADNGNIAIAELIGISESQGMPSIETVHRIETYLANKWGIDGIPGSLAEVPVKVASGATLDLGGLTLTASSFTGGGTVQNGTLYTTSNVYTNNGALAIAAVDNMTVVLDAGATSLTLNGDATGVTIDATEEFMAAAGTVTIAATGLTEAPTFSSAINSTIFRYGATDNGGGTWTVGAISSYTAATYTWSPVNNSTDWTSLANWKVGEQAVAVLPQSVDTVVFPASEDPNFTGWTVALGENRTVNTVQFNANTTLSGGMFYVQGVSGGSGVVVTLGNSAGFANNGSNLTISLTMVVTAEEATPARFYSSDTNNSVNNKIILGADSKVTGSGYVKFNAGYDHYSSCVVEIRGDMTEFEGHVIVANGEGGAHRENTYMTSYGQSAYWTINNSSRADSRPNLFASQTYYFGSLTGSPGHYGDTTFTLEVGNLNQNDTLGGNYCRTLYTDYIKDHGGTIRKVGTGTMMFSGSCVHAYEVNAGTLYIVSEKSLRTYWDSTSTTRYTDTYSDEDHAYYPTITFGGENGGTLKLADAVDWDVSAQLRSDSQSVRFETDVARTWSTALDLSNTALVKSGSGTLTLSAAPLAEEFAISVEAGKVVVPNTVTNTKPAKGTKRTTVGGNYEYEKGDEALATNETEEKTGLADQAAADELAHTYNVTLNDAQTTQGLKANYYKVKATATATAGTYTMSVVLDEDEVGVDLGESDEGVDAPVTFTDNNPTFNLKNSVKKGLYYSVGTVASPTAAEVTVLAEQQATEDGEAISLTPTSMAFDAGNVIYYKLSVSDTAQVTNN